MIYSKQQLWERFQKYYSEYPTLGLSLDLSRVNIDDAFFAKMQPRVDKALAAMKALESGAIANPDEGRMVGHYWLRNPSLAPTPEIRREIEHTLAEVNKFATDVHSGRIRGATGPFKNYLLIGIGGSALGPQFVANALGDQTTDKLRPFFLDNTDPHGMRRVFRSIGSELGQTLCLVVSKSGGTKETRNGMLEAKVAYEKMGLDFGKHAVAITRKESALDAYAVNNHWLYRFPMWDWVGGRTSVTSAVGLLPAILQGFEIGQFLAGAKACDEVTRREGVNCNPAIQLALAWFCAGEGWGKKNMIVLPYKDSLELFPRYLQQLVMESIGKEIDSNGKVVNQGISVFGNKGSTDQHSYIQQVIDGLNNSFVTFVGTLSDQSDDQVIIEGESTSGDFLNGFLLGTRQALAEKGRESVTITIRETSSFSIGVLIALFERAVGFYASLVDINAYHQPGVESGKKAASMILEVQEKVLSHLTKNKGLPLSTREIVLATELTPEFESVYWICERLAANPSRGVKKIPAERWLESAYLKI